MDDQSWRQPPTGPDNKKQVEVNQREIARRLDAAANALDRAENHASEWGHASVASAVLVKTVDNKRFFIDARKDDGKALDYPYFEAKVRANVQGAAARYAEEFFGAKAEVQIGQDVTLQREGRIQQIDQETRRLDAEIRRVKKETELRTLTEPPAVDPSPTPTTETPPALPEATPATPETTPTGEDTTTGASGDLLPDLQPDTGKTAGGSVNNIFVNSAFTPPQTLLAKGATPKADGTPDLATLSLIADELKLSESDILKVAGSNVVTKNLLNYITDPVDPGSNNVAWFMVTQVSVSPGSRTSRDYIAETTLHPYYAKKNSTTGEIMGDFDPNKAHPGIFAAFPLVEAQALDLRNSERFETRLSFALAAKLLAEGKKAEAKFFLEKVTKIQQDVATRTQLPLVVPSSNGREVTYRFDPGLQGLIEPGNRKKGSGLVLNPNSIPALIVIITDRENLSEFSHLHFQLSTRWIPKKRANMWSSTWDGITRNYNPRTPMSPSDVIDAARSIDIAKAHLDWADYYKIDQLPDATMSTGLRGALQQARQRCSALELKIGSSNSFVALPLHYQISPATLEPKNNEQQHVLVEKYSGGNWDNKLSSSASPYTSISIGSFSFLPKSEYDSKRESLQLQIEEEKALQKRQADQLELSLREASEFLLRAAIAADPPNEAGNTKTRRESPKPAREGGLFNLLTEAFLGKRPTPKPGPSPVIEPEPTEVERVIPYTTQLTNLAEALALSNENLPLVVGELLSTPEIQASLKTLPAAGGNNDIDLFSTAIRSKNSFEERQRSTSSKTAQLDRLGYFTVQGTNQESIMITFPADRSRNLPPGILPVIGHSGIRNSYNFGNLQVNQAPIATIRDVTGAELPSPIPPKGHVINVTGVNLDQVRTAFWSSSHQRIAVLSKSPKLIQLGISIAKEDEKYIILSDSIEPPSPAQEARILDYFSVTHQKRPSLELSVSQDKIWAVASSPTATIRGTFPAGVTASLSIDENGVGERAVAIAIDDTRTKVTINLEPEDFPKKVGGLYEGSVKFRIPDMTTPATASLILKDDRVSISGVFPSDLSTKEITESKVDEIQIFGNFHESLGQKVQVFIGGTSCLATVKSRDLISVTGFGRLAEKSGDQTMMIVFGANAFEVKQKITVSSPPDDG